MKQIHHEELENSDKERPSAFPKIVLKQTDSGIQQLHGAGERTEEQQRGRRPLVDRPQCEHGQRDCASRRVHRQYQRRLRWNGFGGTRYWGWMIPTMEKPLATKTLIAVITEASRIAFVVVINFSRTLAGKQAQLVPPQRPSPKRWEPSRDTQPQTHPAQIFRRK